MSDAILFIDDERFYAQRYIEKLEEDYTVIYAPSLERGLAAFKEHPEIAAVILDIMMPAPSSETEEVTNHGLDTGLLFLRDLKEALIARRVPVLILTNRHLEGVEASISAIGLPSKLSQITPKSQLSAPHLLITIAELLEAASNMV